MHKYTVSLRITSSELDVAQVTKELGLTPTQTRSTADRKSANAVWEKALWEFEVHPQNRTDWDSLEEGVARLLKIFDSHADAVRGYGEKPEVFIWCGIFSSSFDGGPHLSAGMLKALGYFGVSLWLDTYSSKNQ